MDEYDDMGAEGAKIPHNSVQIAWDDGSIPQIWLFLIYQCVFWIPETFRILVFNFPEYHRNTYLTERHQL